MLIIRADRNDLWILLVYVVLAGVFSLAVPLTAQAVVNTIAAGLFIQPLVVLTLLAFLGLSFAGVLRLLELALVETLQQRIFARVALQLADQLPRVRADALNTRYAPELVNRFFDVLTVQKSWAKILLDGPAALLQVAIGLVLMAFYSPLLLAFNFVVVVFVVGVGLLGLGGLKTSIRESVQKYRVAEWLEELGRCHMSFKQAGVPAWLLQEVDQRVVAYLTARKQHFRILFRQATGNVLFQALASAGILGLGGWLVINKQLTLGQLVASELIILNVLSALDKLVAKVESLFDLLTGIDKVGHLTDLPTESPVPTLSNVQSQSPLGLSVVVRQLGFSYLAEDHQRISVLTGASFTLPAGARIGLTGHSGVGKTTLAALLCGLHQPQSGSIEYDGIDFRDAPEYRHLVGVVQDLRELFNGTLEENITLGRPGITHQQLREIMDLTGLSDDVARMPLGLKTPIISEGRNLSQGQARRVLLARVLVTRPRLLILDEVFEGLPESLRQPLMRTIFDRNAPWTLLVISHSASVLVQCDDVLRLEDGKIYTAE